MDGKISRPTHRDKAAMNGAQTYLFAKLRRVAGSVSGPPAKRIYRKKKLGHPPSFIILAIMKRLFLCVSIVLCAHLAYSQSEPIVAVDNIAVIHEHKGWRVIDASTRPIHFNLIKGDLIVRIDGKNAAETGPMRIASLFNEGHRREIDLFIERGDFRMEIGLREIAPKIMIRSAPILSGMWQAASAHRMRSLMISIVSH